ncbi:MAG: tRNA (adenosine(37)-N6)-threonylcarbamoyltransferase complex ATPase subunit type 1 TsaE [Burkholderiaceae bacterium]|nr:MAG: tRNA (adenosine(37)-N6)-threonylcarbamoyltransferase complex ATPase subunit type 1 TsaE [Burkholderiaceae bacterium]
MSDSLSLTLPDEAATAAFAQRLGAVLQPGMVVFLHGDLGAGKSTLVRALLRSLGVTGAIKSPTYTLVEPYVISGIYFYHFDFYRFVDPDEWLDAGFDEYLNGSAVALIEWPERAGELLPRPDLELSLSWPVDATSTGRVLTLSASTATGKKCLDQIAPTR